MSVNLVPQRILWLQLLGIVWSFRLSISGLWVLSGLFVCQFRASEDNRTIWLQLSGIVCFFCLSILGLRGHSGSTCRVLAGLFVCQFWASGNTLVPAVGYCLIFLCVYFGPQEKLWLQLSGIVCFFCCPSISGFPGHSGCSCREFSDFSSLLSVCPS